MNKNFVKYIPLSYSQIYSNKVTVSSFHYYLIEENKKKNFLTVLSFTAIKFKKIDEKLSDFLIRIFAGVAKPGQRC